MNIKEYIQTKYPIKDKLQQLFCDPVKSVLEQDDLPCDAVLYVDNKLQKVVYVSDDTYVTVVELLSYLREEVEQMSNGDEFKSAYLAYMDNIKIEDMDLDGIMSASRDYYKNKDEKEVLLHKME